MKTEQTIKVSNFCQRLNKNRVKKLRKTTQGMTRSKKIGWKAGVVDRGMRLEQEARCQITTSSVMVIRVHVTLIREHRTRYSTVKTARKIDVVG